MASQYNEHVDKVGSDKHPQVYAKLNGHTYLVDEKIKYILEALNDNGFITSNSCQNNFGKIWIEFNQISHWEQLMKYALYNHLDQNIEQRKKGDYDNGNTLWGFINDNVSYNVIFNEADYDNDDEYEKQTGGFTRNYHLVSTISIRFDKELLSEFTKYFNDVFGIFNHYP